jgi:hypothetical protein
MELSIGDSLRTKQYNNREILTTTKYIIILPIVNKNINGMVVAFHSHNGQLAWSCNYEDSLAKGVYRYYNDGGALEYSYDYIDPIFQLRNIAIKCAEQILD